jgi:hypothetical protein
MQTKRERRRKPNPVRDIGKTCDMLAARTQEMSDGEPDRFAPDHGHVGQNPAASTIIPSAKCVGSYRQLSQSARHE